MHCQMNAMVGQIGVVSHHVRSLSDVIKLTMLRVFLYAEYNILIFRFGRLHCTSTWFDLLTTLNFCNLLFTVNEITKQLAFLTVSSSPSLKKIAQILKPLILAKSPYFHGLWYFHLNRQRHGAECNIGLTSMLATIIKACGPFRLLLQRSVRRQVVDKLVDFRIPALHHLQHVHTENISKHASIHVYIKLGAHMMQQLFMSLLRCPSSIGRFVKGCKHGKVDNS